MIIDPREQFKNRTMARQPRPGPGSYSIPSTFERKYKPTAFQFFGSTNARFQGSVYHKGLGTGIPEIGPGSYDKLDDIKASEDTKKKDFKKN